jgi:hypothetical protein
MALLMRSSGGNGAVRSCAGQKRSGDLLQIYAAC